MKPFSGATKLCFVFLLLFVCSCASTQKHADHYDASYTIIDSSISKDQKMASFLTSYRKGMDTIMNEIIGYSDMPLSKAQPECTLGDFMVDAQLKFVQQKYPKVKISVVNYGGIRIPFVAAGAISKGKIYEVMPFDNTLTIIDIPGKTLKQFCDHMAAYGGWPVSGLTYKIKGKQAQDILVQNEPINDQLIYEAVVPDYVANGGDNCDFLVDCKKEYLSVFTRDALINYISALNAKNEKLHINIEKRVSYAE